MGLFFQLLMPIGLGLVSGRVTHLMPCWNTELRLVLQMMTSAHCTTTILTKNAVWQVNSTILRCSYVCADSRAV